LLEQIIDLYSRTICFRRFGDRILRFLGVAHLAPELVGGAVKERARGATEMAGVAVQLLEIDKNTLEFVKLLKLKKVLYTGQTG